jgi:hypothetical protein
MRNKYCSDCGHWKNTTWRDGKGVLRLGKCEHPEYPMSAEEAETTRENPPCWEARI